MESYSKRMDLIRAIIWMSFGNIIYLQKTKHKKPKYYMIPIIQNTQNRQIYRDRKISGFHVKMEKYLRY